MSTELTSQNTTGTNPACLERNGWAAVAYRWGWTNNGGYIVRVTTDLRSAEDAADAEAMHRGGKYGVTVYDTDGNPVYHSPSLYGEKAAHFNPRIDLFERVGQAVVCALENGEPLTDIQIEKRWQDEKRVSDAIANALRQPNTLADTGPHQ